MKFWQNAEFLTQDAQGISLRLDAETTIRVSVLEDEIFRVSAKRREEWVVPSTWSIAPGLASLPMDGRERGSLEGFSCPSITVTQSTGFVVVESTKVRLEISLTPLQMRWFTRVGEEWLPSFQDRPANAYGSNGKGWSHFVKRDVNTSYFGLGEKTGPLLRNEKKYEMRNVDAMDYHPTESDPLYKHIPFYLAKTPKSCVGIFYDNMAQAFFDFGRERENYYGFFSSYQCTEGDLDFYVIHGESLAQVSKRYLWLTGITAFPPKNSLRYSGSTMGYTEAQNAQECIGDFLQKCAKNRIPVGSFQLSSGYCMHGKHRWVFVWNKEKFPDFAALSESAGKQGIEFSANIKPVVFTSHPEYESLKSQKLFLENAAGPELSYFWDGYGSHLDFSLPAARAWWKEKIKSELFEKGIRSTWNDNNEFHIQDETVSAQGIRGGVPVPLVRPVMSLLMCQASYEAHKEAQPTLRPWLITRAGGPGLHRYCQTWTGDNRTSWDSLRWNLLTGLSLSISGVLNWGVDVGGFSGPRPDPELLVRWIQQGVFYPRFTIHSWNDDGTVTEPWMYPEVLPIVRAWMQLREELVPYLYNLFYLAHTEHEPLARPLWWGHEDDPHAWNWQQQFFLGHLLVCPVSKAEQKSMLVYLPESEHGWNDFFTHQWHAGGQTIEVPISLDRIPVFVKSGSMIPLLRDNTLVWKFYLPRHKCTGTFHFYDDDGISNYQKNESFRVEGQFSFDGKELKTEIHRAGNWIPAYKTIVLDAPGITTRVNSKRVKEAENLWVFVRG